MVLKCGKALYYNNYSTGAIQKLKRGREYCMNKRESEDAECIVYRERITEIIGKIDNKKLLKRIYALAEYLYIEGGN